MNWWQPVNLYCERASADFGAEPVNTATNAIFIVVGVIGIYKSIARDTDWALFFLSAVVISVGVGSTLFHYFAVQWTRLADLLPIWFFVGAYMFVALRRLLRFSALKSALTLGFLVCVSYVFVTSVPTSVFRITNGSIEYTPALVAATLLATYLHVSKHPSSPVLLLGTLSIWLAVFFRSIDLEYCDQFRIGTHFFWHIFSGVSMGFFLQALHVSRKNSAFRRN